VIVIINQNGESLNHVILWTLTQKCTNVPDPCSIYFKFLTIYLHINKILSLGLSYRIMHKNSARMRTVSYVLAGCTRTNNVNCSFLPSLLLDFVSNPSCLMFITTIISYYNPILYSNVAVFGPLTSHCSTTHSAFEAFVFHSFHLLNSLDLPSTSFCHWFIVSLSILRFQLTFLEGQLH
jgi:hypothetical protein